MPRALLLVDGPSDQPIGRHVTKLARARGCELDVVSPDLTRLSPRPGHAVDDRLKRVLAFDDDFDLVIVHRDAEGHPADQRRQEVLAAVEAVKSDLLHLPVIPVRMTEAWLLVDEEAIRRVAGRPGGREPLNLPSLRQVESVPDAKKRLQDALVTASGASGRRLKIARKNFAGQRRRLLEELDHAGPISELSAWKALETSVQETVTSLGV
jgi:hypothetical protein